MDLVTVQIQDISKDQNDSPVLDQDDSPILDQDDASLGTVVTPQTSKTKNGRTEIWTEKYRPENLADLVGNELQVDEIETWFKAYKNKDPNIKRALLFSGPPGLGKTTLAHAVLIKHGYKVKEYNASDVRSKKLVHKNLYHIINIGSVDKNSPDFKNFGIIMDEVDGMSSGDMGGMAELISFINPARGKRSVKKEEKTALAQRWIPPIICICNDNTDKKMKELKKDCQEIVFKKPAKKDLRIVIDKVAKYENFRITEEAADLVCGQAQGDYRRLLTILQNLVTMASFSNSNSTFSDADSSSISSSKSKNYFKNSSGDSKDYLDKVLIDADLVTNQNSIFCSKDLDLHLTEKVNGLFNHSSKPDQLLKIYETEKSLLPMMMHENYLDFIPLQVNISDFDKLSNIRETIDSIVLGDIIDKTMYNNQSWHLQEIHGLASSWVPCFYVNRNKKSAYKKVSFTTALGRFSFQRANQKNINGLVKKINKEDTYSLEDVRALSEIILYNLLEPAGNPELGIHYLVEYNLHINDVKDLIKMNKLEDHYAVLHTSRMKTALLKLYTSHMKKLEDQERPQDISQQFLRDLLNRNERTGLNERVGANGSLGESEQNLRVKGTNTVISFSSGSDYYNPYDPSDPSSDSLMITPTLVQKPKAEEVLKMTKSSKAEKEPVVKEPKVPKAKVVKAKVVKEPKLPKSKVAIKTQSSIAKALSVTSKNDLTSASTVATSTGTITTHTGTIAENIKTPIQIRCLPRPEIKTISTQTLVKLSDSRLKLPPLIVQKPNVTVTVLPNNKVSLPESTLPVLIPTQTSISVSTSNSTSNSTLSPISSISPTPTTNNTSKPLVEGKKIQLRIVPKIFPK